MVGFRPANLKLHSLRVWITFLPFYVLNTESEETIILFYVFCEFFFMCFCEYVLMLKIIGAKVIFSLNFDAVNLPK